MWDLIAYSPKNCQHLIRIFSVWITFFMNEWVIFITVVDLLLKQCSACRVLDAYIKTLTNYDQRLLSYRYSYSWLKNEILLQFFSIKIIAKAFGHCYMFLWQHCINLILDIFFYVQHVPTSFNITCVLQKDAHSVWFFINSVYIYHISKVSYTGLVPHCHVLLFV